jgi:hypothetical protein
MALSNRIWNVVWSTLVRRTRTGTENHDRKNFWMRLYKKMKRQDYDYSTRVSIDGMEYVDRWFNAIAIEVTITVRLRMKMKIQKALEVHASCSTNERPEQRPEPRSTKQSKAMEEALFISIDAGTLMHQNWITGTRFDAPLLSGKRQRGNMQFTVLLWFRPWNPI